MSEAIGSLVVEIGAKVSGLTDALKSVQDSLNKTNENAAKSHSAFGSLWKQFAVGQIAASALQKGIGFLVNSVKDTVSSAIEAEQSELKLKMALESTGRATDSILPSLMAFSTELAKETLYTDDQAQASMALLAQLTELDANGIQVATRGAMGLASVLGIDLNSATMMVAKAAEGNTAALGRYGIKVDETLPKNEQFADLMDQLSGMYSQATAATDTFGGRVQNLGKWFGEVKEAVGGALVKNEAFNELIGKVQKAIIALIESGKLDEWITAISDALTFAIKNLDYFADTVKGLATGGVPGALESVADHLTGIDELCSALEMAGRKEVANFAKSLGDLKIPAEELRKQIELGKDSWEKYKQAVTQNKDATVALKGAVEGYLGRGAELFGLVKKTAPEIKVTAENTAGLGQSVSMLGTIAEGELPVLRSLDIVLMDVGETALGAARNIDDMLSPALHNIPAPEVDTEGFKNDLGEMSTAVDDLIRDITIGWADGIQGLIEGTKSFKDFLGDTWDAIKKTFFRLIADMIAKWLVSLIAPMVAGATTAATTVSAAFTGIGATLTTIITAIGTVIATMIGVVATGIVTIATAVGTAIVALATGIASAATILAAAVPALLTVGLAAAAIYAAFQLGAGIIGAIGNLIGGGGGNSDITDWLKVIYDTFIEYAQAIAGHIIDIKDDRLNAVIEKLDGIKGSVDLTRDGTLNPQLTKVRERIDLVTAAVKEWGKNIRDAITGATGYASGGVAWTPQLATVAESGPEIIIPLDQYRAGTGLAGIGTGGYGASTVHITQNIYAQNLDRNTIDRSAEYLYAAMQRQMARRGN